MKRNAGLIGPLKNISRTNATGIHDTFDAYNWKKDNKWPLNLQYISISPNGTTILENTSTTFTFTTGGFEENTTLYWTILNGNTISADFYNSVVSGSFTLNASTNTGSFTVITSYVGNTSKGNKTFQIQIRTGSISGTVVFTSSTYTIPPPTITTSVSTTSVNEGGNFNFTISVTNVGTYLSTATYNIYISSGTATTADFSGFSTAMVVTLNTSNMTSYFLLDDSTTEGNETVALAGYYYNSQFGVSYYTPQTPLVTINDTSQTPTASVALSANPINEAATMTVTVTTANISNGTTLYWSTENVSNWESVDIAPSSGSFTVNSNSGSFTFSTVADGYTEGTEQFLIRIRLNSVAGTIIGSSATISISDTSTGTPEPVSLASLFPALCDYLDDYMTEYRNPSFYSYTLDGAANYISDGGGDMYDGGNYTTPWLISGTDYSTSLGDSGVSLSYSVTTPTTIDTSFVYRSLGYSTAQLPLTMLGYRNTSNTVVGFQKSGNSGADGGGSLASSLFYNGVTLNTFTVYAFNRQTYNAGDPSHCDLYMLIGHPNWGSSFGTVTSYAHPVSAGSNGGRLHTSTGSTNVIAVTMLLSKSGGVQVTDAECQTVVTNFTSRMKTHLGY